MATFTNRMEVKMEYLSIPQIACELDISDNTVRRYIKRFKEFFQDTHIKGRVTLHKAPEVIQAIKNINHWYNNQGHNRDTIRKKLKEKYSDMDNPTPDIQDTTTDSEVIQMLKRIETKVDSNTKTLKLLLSDTPDTSLESKNNNESNTPDSIPDIITVPDHTSDTDREKLPNCNCRTMTTPERDNYLFLAASLYSDNKIRAQELNKAAILTKNHKEWTVKNYRDNLRNAKKRRED